MSARRSFSLALPAVLSLLLVVTGSSFAQPTPQPPPSGARPAAPEAPSPGSEAQPGAESKEAKPLEVTQTTEPKQVQLGEPFTLTIAITHPRAERYELQTPSTLNEFELLEHRRKRSDSGDQATTRFELQLSAFELGTRSLPPLTFDVNTPEGRKTFTATGAAIEVVSALPPDAEQQGAGLYDIRGPEEVPVPSYTLLWVLLGLIAAALIAWLLYRWWKNRPKGVVAPAGPPRPLELRTLDALNQLRAEDLPAQGRIKEFYTRLSDIVRGYLGERYGVEALECTTSELLSRLEPLPAPGLRRDALATFLTDADLVKFAKAQMTPEDCERSLQFGYLLVDETTPKPTPPDAPARQLS